MKLIDNIEMSNVKEVVISHKVFYIKDGEYNYKRDDARTAKSAVKNENGMPVELCSEDMAEYIRDYIGVKGWKFVISLGTINIFKKQKKGKKGHEKVHANVIESKKPKKVSKKKE
jgi:hypothetical protein